MKVELLTSPSPYTCDICLLCPEACKLHLKAAVCPNFNPSFDFGRSKHGAPFPVPRQPRPESAVDVTSL
jgi:hypothetical protein